MPHIVDQATDPAAKTVTEYSMQCIQIQQELGEAIQLVAKEQLWVEVYREDLNSSFRKEEKLNEVKLRKRCEKRWHEINLVAANEAFSASEKKIKDIDREISQMQEELEKLEKGGF